MRHDLFAGPESHRPDWEISARRLHLEQSRLGDKTRASCEAANRRGFSMAKASIMRKLISATMAGVTLFGLSAGMVGCSDETGSKEEVKVTTPGGATKETKEIKVQKSGENPPLAPSDTAKP